VKAGAGRRAPGSGKQERAATELGERYARQVIVPGIGEAGQARLAAARVVVLGAGGLGFPVLTYLGAAGLGAITIVDRDVVERSNLNRQCLFTEADLGRPKAATAALRLAALNSTVRWEPVQEALDEALAARLLAGADLAFDCADNWEARGALAAAAWRAGVPLLHGAVAAFEGTVAWFVPPAGPCFHCVYPEALRPDGPTPVLGAVAGVVGSLMAAEAVRALCGIGRRRSGELLLLDLERGSFDWVRPSTTPGCPLCGGAC
jgi:molybdopterin/thiamine biosynthesis adenylyltransferase